MTSYGHGKVPLAGGYGDGYGRAYPGGDSGVAHGPYYGVDGQGAAAYPHAGGHGDGYGQHPMVMPDNGWGYCPPIGLDPRCLIRPRNKGLHNSVRPTG